MLAALLWMLATTICSPHVVAYFYVPAGSAAPVCPVRFEALDPNTDQLLGEQEVSLADGPQQVTLNSGAGAGACSDVRLAVTRVLDNGCVEPSELSHEAGNPLAAPVGIPLAASATCQKAGFDCSLAGGDGHGEVCVCVQVPRPD